MTTDEARAELGTLLGVPPEGTGAAIGVTVPCDRWTEAATFARHSLGCGFFSFLTVVDWKTEGLEVIARVENLDALFSLTMKTRLEPGLTTCPSIMAVYRGADWMEREAFDMFGVVFEGHPDLRRILLPDDWVGHPLLKSYAVDTPYPPYR
ncbi:MAG: NADH-quinone oxidoreductase subunit C [Vicinamibacterales bacterium]